MLTVGVLEIDREPRSALVRVAARQQPHVRERAVVGLVDVRTRGRVRLTRDRIGEIEVGVSEVRRRGRVLGVLEPAEQRLDGVAIGVEAVIGERSPAGQALEALRDEARVIRADDIHRRPPNRAGGVTNRSLQGAVRPGAIRVPGRDVRVEHVRMRPAVRRKSAVRNVIAVRRDGRLQQSVTPGVAGGHELIGPPIRRRSRQRGGDAKRGQRRDGDEHAHERARKSSTNPTGKTRDARHISLRSARRLPGHSSLGTPAFLAVAVRNINTTFYVVKGCCSEHVAGRARSHETCACNQRAEAFPTSRSRAMSVQRSDLRPSATALPRIGQIGQK